ncbi:hypothetical protein PsorP6_005058 [Peronosclerospora sorghi]|uniref:Uncharacterized protein n=1 Tax=Peronosclerospora sorghi TaxID=230839 RepID=A0ACC0W6J9_9STRA|nr:hypothetical protein PsorP6_005058 [Peronosclerospora sorghi]
MTPQRNQSPQWIIYVSSTFSSSCPFFDVSIDETFSMRLCTLLSVRVAVYFPPDQELQNLAHASSTQNVTNSCRLEKLLAMHKRLVIAIFHSGNELPVIRQLQQLRNVTVIIQPTIDSLCEQLHEVSHQERTQGYELPSPRACSSDTSAGDLDASFTSRLQFFRTKASTSAPIECDALATDVAVDFRVDSPRRSNTPDAKGAATLSCTFWSMELLHEQRL